MSNKGFISLGNYVARFIAEARSEAKDLSIDLLVDHRIDIAVGAENLCASRQPEYSECTAPWRWLNDSTLGDVYPCCQAVAPVGSLKTETLTELWNGEAIQPSGVIFATTLLSGKYATAGAVT